MDTNPRSMLSQFDRIGSAVCSDVDDYPLACRRAFNCDFGDLLPLGGALKQPFSSCPTDVNSVDTLAIETFQQSLKRDCHEPPLRIKRAHHSRKYSVKVTHRFPLTVVLKVPCAF